MHKGPQAKKLVPLGIKLVVGGLGAVVTLLGFSGCPSHPNLTSPPSPTTSKADEGRSAMTSRIMKKTVIAGQNDSEMISIPSGHWFRIEPRGCVEVSTASGKSYRDCPGEHHALGENITLRDGMFKFKSLTGKDEEVIVEWEPK